MLYGATLFYSMLQKRVVKWRNSAKNGHKRVCEWCGKEFAAKTVRTRFCSDRCSKTAYKHNKRLEFVSNFNLEQVSEKSQTMGRRKDTLCPLRAYTRSFRRTRCHLASSEARPTTACHMSQGSSPRDRRNPSRKSQNGTPARRS